MSGSPKSLPPVRDTRRDMRAVFFNGPAMIQFAMRPRYGKKSTLYKRRWVYIAGMRSFGPLKTYFGENCYKFLHIRIIPKIEKERISGICVLRRNLKSEVRSRQPEVFF